MKQRGGVVVLGTGLVLLCGGCPLFEVEVEVGEVCVRYDDLELPGSDGSGVVHDTYVFEDFASLEGLDQLSGEVEFVKVTLRAKTGVSNFDFLEAATVSVAGSDPASTLPEQTVVDCAGDGCVRDGASLTALASAPVDALPYLQGEPIAITIDVAGDLPTTAWKVDLEVCMSGKVSYSAGL